MNLPVAFRFQICFQGISPVDQDYSFQSIIGLEAMFEKNPSSQGSQQPENYTATHPPLVLKRAVQDSSTSGLTQWLARCLQTKNVTVIPQATIQLLSHDNRPYMQWTIKNIVPKSWKLGELHSERNEVLIETIELYYEELSFVSPVAGS